MPHSMQASLRENSRSPPSSVLTTTMSSARLSAISMRLGEPALDARLHDQPVDDDVDRMIAPAVELDVLVERTEHAVDARLREPLLLQLGKLFLELPFSAADDRSEHVDAGILRIHHHHVHDALERLRRDLASALMAVRDADVGEQQPQVIVDFRDGADRRSRIRGGGLLLDGDGRRQAVDQIDVRLLHLLEKLPGVGRQRLDIAALSFGVNRVEGKGRLARPGQAGNDRQLVPRNIDVDIAEVMNARAAYRYPALAHLCAFLREPETNNCISGFHFARIPCGCGGVQDGLVTQSAGLFDLEAFGGDEPVRQAGDVLLVFGELASASER